MLRSEVAPFFTLACICQAVIAPWGRLLPRQRKENSNQSHDAQPVFLSSACRGVEFTSMSDADERVVVCFRNGWVFHATAGRRRCHGVRRLPTGWRLRFYFRSTELNFTQICCKDDEKYYTVGIFTLHCQECTFFLSTEYTSLCVFAHRSAPEVCLMWPDAEKELLFRFQSLPKPHLGAMRHRRLLAVIDLRSGTLDTVEKKSGCQMRFCCPVSTIQWN